MKISKVLSLTVVFMLLFSAVSFAAVPAGIVVIDDKAYDLQAIANTEFENEINDLFVSNNNQLLFKDFEEKWFDALGQEQTNPTLPEKITLKKGDGTTEEITTVEGLKVKSVSAITTTFVEVEFSVLEEAMEDVTVVVKDNTGATVAVDATDIPAGATSAQFDLTKAYTDDLEGIWTVDGVEYSFVVIEQFEAIMDAVGSSNQVELLAALNDAGIENIDEALIADYLTDIDGASPAPADLGDIQDIIDQTNEDAADASDDAAVVKTVADATTQVQLLNALQANFERVNPDWITDYAEEVVGEKVAMLALTEANYVGETDAVTVDDIQTAIDIENAGQINTADAAADTAAEQAEVTTLIENWVEADDPDSSSTPKADAIEDSNINRLGFVVAEATTQNSLYNALVAYANATNDSTLEALELNSNLKAEYLTEMDASSGTKRAAAVSGFTEVSSSARYDYKTNIVQAADLAALTAALSDINGLTSDNTADEVKAALQELADVTEHKTGSDNFDMSTVKDDKLLDYVTESTDGFASKDINSIPLVNAAITTVNDSVEENTALETITSSSSTVDEVEDALLELALDNSNDATDAFVDASSQVRLEVAELIVDNSSSLADPLTVESVTDYNASSPSYDANAIQKAMEDHGAKVGQFNAIADLSSASNSAIKTALDNYDYDDYADLNDVEKVAVAEEISKLTKDVDGTATPLDFSSDDAVETLEEANTIIEDAIAAIK